MVGIQFIKSSKNDPGSTKTLLNTKSAQTALFPSNKFLKIEITGLQKSRIKLIRIKIFISIKKTKQKKYIENKIKISRIHHRSEHRQRKQSTKINKYSE